MQTEQSGPFLSEQSSPSDSLLSPKESSGRRFFLRKAPQKHKSPPQAKPPPLHGAAGGSQPQASLDGSLVREDRMELAAALLQAHARGRQSRVEVNKGMWFVPKVRAALAIKTAGKQAASLGRAHEKLVARNAHLLFPSTSKQQAIAMLEALRARLDGVAEAPWGPWFPRDTPVLGYVSIDVAPPDTSTKPARPRIASASASLCSSAVSSSSLASSLAPPDAAPPRRGFLARARSATRVQAVVRGLQTRKHLDGREEERSGGSVEEEEVEEEGEEDEEGDDEESTGEKAGGERGSLSLFDDEATGKLSLLPEKGKRKKAAAEEEPQVDCRPRLSLCGAAAALLLGLPLLLALLLLSPWLLLAAAAAYAYLRFPRLLGWVASHLISRLGMFGYPFRIHSLHLSPWVDFRASSAAQARHHAAKGERVSVDDCKAKQARGPWLRLQLHVEGVELANPPSLHCAHKDFLKAGSVDTLVTLDLSFLGKLLRTGKLSPAHVVFESFDVKRAQIFFELKAGELNINGLVRELAEREVCAALAARGKCLGLFPRPCRAPTPPTPNLLRLRIGAVRGLKKLRGARPFVAVKVRGTELVTSVGSLALQRGAKHARGDGSGSSKGSGHSEGEAQEWLFDDEVLLRLPDPSAVVHVCVYCRRKGTAEFDARSRRLLGQWVVTAKYLITCPHHCKHMPPLSVGRDGALSGTFLLADKRLRGSAVRSFGPSELGRGLSGEIDMRIHWAHVEQLPPLKAPRRTAMAQLQENSTETTLRMGNVAELRGVLGRLPLRLSCGDVCFREAEVSIKDLFTGYKGDVERDLRRYGQAEAAELGVEDMARYYARIEEMTDVVRIRWMHLRPVAAKDGSDLPLDLFLERLLFDQLVPQALKEVFGTSLGGQAIGSIMAGLGARSAAWFQGIGRDIRAGFERSVQVARKGAAVASTDPAPPVGAGAPSGKSPLAAATAGATPRAELLKATQKQVAAAAGPLGPKWNLASAGAKSSDASAGFGASAGASGSAGGSAGGGKPASAAG